MRREKPRGDADLAPRYEASSGYGIGARLIGLGEFAAVAAGVFEQGEQIGHAEEGARRFAEVDEFEFAAAGAAGDVESGEGAESGRVHVLDLLHVDDDALFVGQEGVDLGAEMGRVFEGEFAVALDDDGLLGTVAADVEGGVGGVGRAGQVCLLRCVFRDGHGVPCPYC